MSEYDARGAFPRAEMELTDSEFHTIRQRHATRARTGTAPELQIVEPEMTWPRAVAVLAGAGLLVVGVLVPAAGPLIPIATALLGWIVPAPRLSRRRRVGPERDGP